MRYEVEVIMPKPLDDATRRFLDAVQRSANQLVSFRGDSASTTLVVEVAGMAPKDAVRSAAGEVGRIFPNNNDEKYGKPRVLRGQQRLS